MTSEGKPVTGLTGPGSEDIESVSLSTNPKFITIIERERRRYKDEGGVSSEDARKTFAESPAS
jgi:hypothetical protein